MKVLTFFASLFIFAFSIQKASAQSNFQPGFIITNDSDTIHGLVDYRGDLRSSTICTFKVDNKSNAQEYKPEEIKGYRILDSKFYISKEVNSENQTKMLFLEYLVNGISDLYYFRDNNGDHYLIQNQDGKILKLSDQQRTIQVQGKNYVGNSKKYIGLLKANFGDCIEIQPEIEKAGLNHKSLSKIVENYHGYVCNEECIVYQKQLPKVVIKFAAELGINVTQINFHEKRYYSIFPFEKSIYPSIGIATNILLPRINEKLSFDINAEFGSLSYKIEDYKKYTHEGTPHQMTEIIDLDFHATYLKGSGSIKYTVPKGKVRPTASLGFGIQRFLKAESQKNTTILFGEQIHTQNNTTYPIRPNFYFITGRIGAVAQNFKKGIPYTYLKYEFALEEVTGGKNLSGGNLTKLTTASLVFGYYF